MSDPNDGNLHVWSDEQGSYFIARDRAHLAEMTVGEGLDDASFVALPDDYELTLVLGGEDDDDGLEEGVRKSCADWIAQEGPGKLGGGGEYE